MVQLGIRGEKKLELGGSIIIPFSTEQTWVVQKAGWLLAIIIKIPSHLDCPLTAMGPFGLLNAQAFMLQPNYVMLMVILMVMLMVMVMAMLMMMLQQHMSGLLKMSNWTIQSHVKYFPILLQLI